MPMRSQPIPPIYQPEVAARGILRLIDHPTREVLLGTTTVMAVQGTKVIPGLLDRFMALTAYDSQLTDEPNAPHPDNLFGPVERDMGVHGRFTEQAKDNELDARVSSGGFLPAAAAAAVLALAGLAIRALRR
jgi:hypothetical protein